MMKWKVLNCCGGQRKWMMCVSGGSVELCLYRHGMFEVLF